MKKHFDDKNNKIDENEVVDNNEVENQLLETNKTKSILKYVGNTVFSLSVAVMPFALGLVHILNKNYSALGMTVPMTAVGAVVGTINYKFGKDQYDKERFYQNKKKKTPKTKCYVSKKYLDKEDFVDGDFVDDEVKYENAIKEHYSIVIKNLPEQGLKIEDKKNTNDSKDISYRDMF